MFALVVSKLLLCIEQLTLCLLQLLFCFIQFNACCVKPSLHLGDDQVAFHDIPSANRTRIMVSQPLVDAPSTESVTAWQLLKKMQRSSVGRFLKRRHYVIFIADGTRGCLLQDLDLIASGTLAGPLQIHKSTHESPLLYRQLPPTNPLVFALATLSACWSTVYPRSSSRLLSLNPRLNYEIIEFI